MRRLAILLSLALLWGCENDTSNELAGPSADNTDKTCLGCHSSETRLREALGPVDELEAWQKVIITGANGDQFLNSEHGPNYPGTDRHPLTCQSCHGGARDYAFDTMDEAHAGLIDDPSAVGQVACLNCHLDETWTTACDACHQEIVAASSNSLHTNLWGFKNAIEQRCAADFGSLGAPVQAGFEASCASCHATCGQCHVSRPNTAGGGFPVTGASLSHRFVATPDQNQQCVACHVNVGADFLGELPGNQADVHGEAGKRCEFCHDAQEIHGDAQYAGTHYESRFEVATMPRCEECHATLEANIAHIHHAGANPDCGQCHHNEGSDCGACHRGGIAFAFAYPLPVGQCQTCHAQPYQNCSNCHGLTAAGGWDIDPPAVQFKIARNANPERSEYDFVVVRHAPVAPETFAEWGLNLPRYSDQPTWTYSAPHNIQRRTTQANVAGQNCYVACHNSASGPDGFLLRESDLTGLADYEANLGIVIPETFPHAE